MATAPSNTPPNYLEMSDEEILKMGVPEDIPASTDPVPPIDPITPTDPVDPSEPKIVDPVDPVDPPADSKKLEDPADPVDPINPEVSGAAGVTGAGAAAQPPKQPEQVEPAKPVEGKETTTPDPEKDPKEIKPAPAEVDYKAEYEKLLAPFKANGRDIKINSVDDAITLMQMGANYNKKMAALKPNLKLLKLLENNGLLSEEKIGFLIDLDKKNPAAINKLVQDSGIDPVDLDADKASAYKQTTYTVDEREIELDTILDEIKDSPGYNRTLDIVGTKWDGASKQTIANTPQILKIINDHVNTGIYDLIQSEMERERMFGRLNGLSDIEAYKQVGDAINARGGFNHLIQGSSQTQGQPPAGTVVTPSKPVKPEDDKLKDKKRAASSTPPAAPAPATPADFNPLALSDEEFAKQVKPQFL